MPIYRLFLSLFLCFLSFNQLFAQEVENQILRQDRDSLKRLLQTRQFKLALPVARKYLTTATEFYGVSDTATATAFNFIGEAFYRNNLLDSCEWAANRAVEISVVKLGEDNLLQAGALLLLAQVDRRKRAYDKALEKLERVLTIQKSIWGENHLKIAIVYNLMGLVRRSQRKYDLALSHFNQTLDIRQNLLGRDHISVSNALNNIGLTMADKGALDEALSYYDKSLNIRLKNLGDKHNQVGNTKRDIATAWYRKGIFDKALQYFKEALDIRLANYGTDHPNVAIAQRNLGVMLEETGAFDSALAYYNKALAIETKHFGADHPRLISTYNNIGVVWMDKAEYNKAIQTYEKVLALNTKHFGVDHPNTAGAYNNIGVVYERKGDLRKAIESHEKALKIREKVFGPDHPILISSYGNLGVAVSKGKDQEKAIRYLKKTEDLTLKNLGEGHAKLSVAYSNLGNVLLQKKEYKKSLAYSEKALENVIRNFGDRDPKLVAVYSRMGRVYSEKEDYVQAQQFYEKALDVALAAYGESHERTASVYNNMGVTLRRKGQYKEALTYFEKALEIKQAIFVEGHPSIASNLHNIGVIWYEKEDKIEAQNYYDKALDVLAYSVKAPRDFSKVSDLLQLRDVFASMEKLYRENLDKERLAIHHQNMLALEDFIQQGFDDPTTRQFYAAQSIPVYETVLANLLESKTEENVEEAFILSEKTRGRFLSEALNLAAAGADFGLPDSLREEEYYLKTERAIYAKRKFTQLEESAEPNDSLVAAIDNELFQLNESKDRFLENLKVNHLDYYNLRYKQLPISVQEVQEKVLSPKNGPAKALVEYFVGDSSIYLFVLLEKALHVRQIKKDFPLEQWVQDLRCRIFSGFVKEEEACRDADVKDFASVAYRLYQRLFAPVDALIPPDAKVIIVPDAALGYLPFDVLLNEQPKEGQSLHELPYLVHKRTISYAYSAGLQLEMQNRTHLQAPSKRLLAFAPSFGESSGDTALLANRAIDIRNRRNWLRPLEFNDDEVRAIDSLIGADVYLDSMATEEKFKLLAGDYRVLHLSTHGKANDQAGDYSFLAFHQLDDSLENEWLYNRELYNLKLNADLVVLSACETGIGELQRGEGIISLARGFSYAGAKSILTSLWSVNDKSTQVLMTLFYTNLKAGMAKDEALRQAKLSYLRDYPNLGAEPYFWAAFIPIGDMSPVNLTDEAVVWWVLGGLLLLGFFVTGYLYSEW